MVIYLLSWLLCMETVEQHFEQCLKITQEVSLEFISSQSIHLLLNALPQNIEILNKVSDSINCNNNIVFFCSFCLSI